MKNKSTTFLIFTVFMIVILVSLVIGLAYYAIVEQERRGRISADWLSTEYTREIGNTSPQFEELWQLSPVFAGTGRNDASIYLSAEDEDLYLLGSLEPGIAESLYAIDIPTGVIKWQIPPDELAMFSPAPNLVISNKSFVYLGYPGSGKIQGDTEIGAAKIVAHSRESGDEVWSQTIGGARDFSSVNVMQSFISTVGSTSLQFYLLDAKSGEVIKKWRKVTKNGRGPHPIYIENEIEYSDTWCEAIQAINLETGQLLWRTPYDFCISHPVIVTDDVLIINPSMHYGDILALNKSTGEVVWRYDDSPIVSNVAFGNTPDGQVVYFMTFDSKLLALDANNGATLGEVEFVPTRDFSTDFLYDPEAVFTRYSFYVTASNDVVIILLGDSRQLFVFRYTLNSINN